MFERLAQRVTAKAEAIAEEARRGIEAAFEQFPDVRLSREGDTIVIEAMGLARRWLGDARLRFAFWRRG